MAYRIDKDLDVDGGAKVSAAPSADTDVVRLLELQAEAEARSDADATIQANIDSEALARADADSTLQANIDAEEAARIAADAALDLRIDGRQPYLGIGNRDDLTLSYSSSTRQVTITGAASVWINGVEEVKANPFVFAAHPATTGGWFFYFDENNDPVVSGTPWDLTLHAPVAYVFYSSALSEGIAFYELHAAHRDPEMHKRLHFVDGTQVVPEDDTFTISGYVLNSDANADKTFAISSGDIMDEDIRRTMTALADGSYVRFYRSGAAGDWTWNPNPAAYPFHDNGTDIQYNQFTGATWQLTALSGTQFVNVWVFALTALESKYQLICITGQAVHASEGEAEAESVGSIEWGTVPFQEIAPLYQITYRRRAANSNQGKADIVRVARLAGSRTSIVTAGTTPTTAAAIGFVPAGDIAATNVQAAIEELDAEKLAGTGLNVAADAPVGQAYGIDEVEVSDGLLVALTLTTLGTAALASTTDFATAAQGALADTAVQPADLVGLALPDYSGAADGDVLTIAAGVPAWEPPTGTGSGLADLWLVLDAADDEPILDAITGTLVRDLSEALA